MFNMRRSRLLLLVAVSCIQICGCGARLAVPQQTLSAGTSRPKPPQSTTESGNAILPSNLNSLVQNAAIVADPAEVRCLAFSNDRRYLFVGCGNGADNGPIGFIWDLKTLVMNQVIRANEFAPNDSGRVSEYFAEAIFTSDNEFLLTTCSDRSILPTTEPISVWSVATGELLEADPMEKRNDVPMALLEDGRSVATYDYEQISVLDSSSFKTKSFPPSLRINQDNLNYLFPAGTPNLGKALARRSLLLSRDFNTLTHTQKDEFVLLDYVTGNITTLGMDVPKDMLSKQLEAIVYEPSSKRIAVASYGDVGYELVDYDNLPPSSLPKKFEGSNVVDVVVYDLITGQKLQTLPLKNVNKKTIQFLPGGRYITCVTDSAFQIWNLQNGVLQKETLHTGKSFPGFQLGVLCPTGATYAYPKRGGVVDLVDVTSGVTFLRLGHPRGITNWSIQTSAGLQITRETPKAIKSEPNNALVLQDYYWHAIGVKEHGKALEGNTRAAALGTKTFVLTVGIGEHSVKALTLKHAGKDAAAVEKCFADGEQAKAGRLFTKSFVDKQATVASIQKGFDWLSESSVPEDQVIVFFAGHSLMGKKGVYFIGYDSDPKGLGFTSCMNWEDIAARLLKVRSKNIVFLTDCCHSGGFGREYLSATQAEVAQKLGNKEGLRILAACSASQLAFETDRFDHGVFTHFLLEALSQQMSSTSANNFPIKAETLLKHVLPHVEEVTNSQQTPLLIQ